MNHVAVHHPQIDNAGFVALVEGIRLFQESGLLDKSLTDRRYPAITDELIKARRAFRDDPTGLDVFNDARFEAGEDELEIVDVPANVVFAWYAEYQVIEARRLAEEQERELARQIAAAEEAERLEAERIEAEKAETARQQAEAETRAAALKTEEERQVKARRYNLLREPVACTCEGCTMQLQAGYGFLPSLEFMRRQLNGRNPTVVDLKRFIRCHRHGSHGGFWYEETLDRILAQEAPSPAPRPAAKPTAQQKAPKPATGGGFGTLGTLFRDVLKTVR